MVGRHDSIELAAGERLRTARRKREVQELAGDGLAWLSPYSSLSADEHRRKLDAAATTGDPAAVRTARDDARMWAEDEARRQDGARIRSALVAELQELGYEVNVQGHEWSEGTRITAARPKASNYDVQLSAVPGGQIQSKVRAYDHAGRGRASTAATSKSSRAGAMMSPRSTTLLARARHACRGSS